MSSFEDGSPNIERLSFNEIVELLKKFQRLHTEWRQINSVHDADDIFVHTMAYPESGERYRTIRTELPRCAEQLNALQDAGKLEGPLDWLRDSDDKDEQSIATDLTRLQTEDGSFPTFQQKQNPPIQLTQVPLRRRWPWQKK